ncbi:SUF system Fe-S cluster assembly protein [Bombella sp. ESL0378]|uniref:SUF system Fe-S cluster assembly protein n=1 Tax=Bombella saccharophila TaxID=2967338 RepID=A0ABT3WBG2_9PROT|nr:MULTISPECIES: SUF system Fe-S cluster assembly protein [Bombella]MCX5614306.1 SUF system Fe-S cluster assembly protein [Bombella saccharophila]MUG04827.1 SUF system Fe-S cluster assembly protein [Bombella sp. ESL0378]
MTGADDQMMNDSTAPLVGEATTPTGGMPLPTQEEAYAGEEELVPPPVDAPPQQDEVIAAIETVFDPEIPVNVYELGLIYTIDLHDDGRVDIEMSLTAPNCPSAQELPQMVRYAVLSVPTVKEVTVKVVWDPPWDMSRMSDQARLALNMF